MQEVPSQYIYTSAVEFIEKGGITPGHLNLTRHQFTAYHVEKEKPPTSLMESAFQSPSNKIAGIFEVNEVDDSVDSPALQKIRIWL